MKPRCFGRFTLLLRVGVVAGWAVTGLAVTRATEVAPDALATQTREQRDARMAWWRDARFGMFIHWNVSSVPAGVYHGKHNAFAGEWLMHDEKIPVPEYRQYAAHFNPTQYDADAWVRVARDAGMKYIVITAKHHDGFAMYHTDISTWGIRDAGPFKRDPIAELAAACQKHGLKLGLYYSQAQDWNHPGGATPGGKWDKAQAGNFDKYLREIAVPQVREILTKYGPVAVLWFDSPYEMNRERANLFLPLLELQPGILFNNRLGGEYAGDFETPEQGLPENAAADRDWEVCMTMNDTWGYKSTDHHWKSAETLIRHLVDIASQGGNYLLNIGPTPEGLMPAASVERLAAVGRWMNTNSAAIYGTSASPFSKLPWGRCTKKVDASGARLYLHIFEWPAKGDLLLPGLKGTVEAAYLLADPAQKPIPFSANSAGVVLALPTSAPDALLPVVVVRITGQLQVTP